MKKLLILLLSISFLAISCTKDEEPAKPIDKFIKTYIGNIKEYSCEENRTLLSTKAMNAQITKENDTDLLVTVKNGSGVNLFTFSGKLDSSNENKFRISNFAYNSETLFGEGEMISGKLKLSFATLSCPVGEQYRVTREFKEQ